MKSKLQYWPLLIIIIILGFLIFFRMNRDLLRDWDECVYTQNAVEMKKTGDFLTSQWNGNLVFEKPPLNTVIMQIPFLFGINEFTARLPSNLFLLLLIIAVYIFSKKYFSDLVAILASLLILASEVIIVYGIKVNTDIGFTLFTFLGVISWFASHKKKSYSYLAGLFFGIAVLNKGLSIIPYLVAIFLSIFINYKKEKIINYLRIIIVFLITILPWHFYEYLSYGQKFLQVYFVEHVLKRTQNSLDFHFEGRLFYLKLIYNNLFPWIFFILIFPLSQLVNFKKYLKLKTLTAILKENQTLFTIILLILVPLVSISLAKTRVAWYAMPIYPFVAVFIAYNIEFILEKLKLKNLSYILILFLIIDSLQLITNEVKINQSKRGIFRRTDVFIKAKNYQKPEIDYLVWYPERRAKDILPQNMQTSTTFIYGGNPCAVYYSGKKVNYYYSIDEFKKRVNQKNGLYVIENGDQEIIKDLPIKVLYNNIDYTLFEN